MRPPHRPDPTTLLGAAATAMAACLVLLRDALLSGGTRIPGAADTETWNFLWGHFWMAQSLLEEHRFPIRTVLQDFPAGGTLWLKDPIVTALLVPVQRLAGVAWAFTLGEVLLLVGAACAAAGLARALGAGRVPAVVAGTAYAFCPHAIGEIYNGNADALNLPWAPLWAWALVAATRSPGWRTAAALAVAEALLFVGNQYYAIAMGFLALPLLAALLAGREGGWRRPLAAVAAGTLGGLLLFAPYGRLLAASLRAPDQLTLIDSGRIPLQPPYVTDLVHLVRPLAPLAHAPGPPPPFQDLVYPGFTWVALALAGLLLRRDRWALLWAAGGVFFLVLSLGPALVVDGQLVMHGGRPRLLPWAWIVTGRPVLGGMTLPQRMAVPAALCWALGAAGLLTRLQRWRGGTWMAAALGAVALAESWRVPPWRIPVVTQDARVTEHLRLLRDHPAPGAVLNLPLQMGQNALSRYFFDQAIHGRPQAASFRQGPPPSVAGMVPWIWRFVEEQELRGHFPDGPRRPEPPPGDPEGRDRFRELGFGWVVLHLDAVPQATRTPVRTWIDRLDALYGPGRSLPDRTRVWATDPEVARELAEGPAADPLSGAGRSGP